jgi:hypothetical protein
VSKTSITEWIREKGSPVATLLVAAALIGGCIGMAGRANADPESVNDYTLRNATAICAFLGQDDSDAGIEAVLAKLWAAGVQPYQSGEVLYQAVHNICPAYEPAVVAWANNQKSPGGSLGGAYQAGKVGGALGV